MKMGCQMLFDSWSDIIRTLVIGVMSYFLLIVLLRISGKRTLSKMNAFDLVVTVALGSVMATILLSKEVSLAEGITAFGTLIGLQYVVAWLSVRSKAFRELVKGTPKLLYYRGTVMEKELQRERVAQDELYAAIRAQGIADMDAVEAVVLETDGTFTVLERPDQQLRQTTLQGVSGEQRVRQPARR